MNKNNIVVYQIDDRSVSVPMVYEAETFWMSQKQIATMFGVNTPAISKHLKNIFADGELQESAVVSKMEITAEDGKTYRTLMYNLDAVIAVGYRVNSKKATQFRIWATDTLREYITKGFVLNDEMLKNGRPFGKDYFDELLERITEIRASERRAYQKITDIFAQCSYDYDPKSKAAHNFYSFVQNKLHNAVTGLTAAELIYTRADAEKEHMGLTTWKGAPHGKIYLTDTQTAKNYLGEKELTRLNRLVTMFIDRAQFLAEENTLMSMNDWVHELDRFLDFNRQNILQDFGKISRQQALDKAKREYEKFRPIQDQNYISDFDKAAKKIIKPKK